MVDASDFPIWYEMYVEVNGREPAIDSEYDTMEELIQSAKQLIDGLKDEQEDLGSWAVIVSPHWCAKNSTTDCECSRVSSNMKVAEFRGDTINDLIGRR